MGAVPQAKTCYYKGVKFKSNLEGKTAEALDNLGIRWEYEPCVFRGPQFIGGQYTPDFLLTGTDIYIEVAAVWDERHDHNSRQLVDMDKEVAWINGDGFMTQIRTWSDDPYAALGRRNIGYYDDKDCNPEWNSALTASGATPILSVVGWPNRSKDEPWNLFDAAGVKRYGGPR